MLPHRSGRKVAVYAVPISVGPGLSREIECLKLNILDINCGLNQSVLA